MSQSIIDGNSSSRGGGIFNKGEATVGLITTISANAATIGGGGLYNEERSLSQNLRLAATPERGLQIPGLTSLPVRSGPRR